MTRDEFVVVPFPADLLEPPKPFWVIARPWEPDPEDLSELERAKALEAKIRADDFGCGLCYASEADAAVVADAMRAESGAEFYVVGWL